VSKLVVDDAYISRQKEWSTNTFGQGHRTKGLMDHIIKEFVEILEDPDDWTEWCDIAILALDGAWRHGGNPQDIIDYLNKKQSINIKRKWAANTGEDVAIEHIRE
jgi:hypothetical protein